MCGFIFYYNKTDINKNDVKKLKLVSSLIKHRGPDYKKIFNQKKIFACHYRLSIQDTNKRSNQPFFSKDKRYMLLYNGEIYNFKEIKLKIKKKYNFTTSSDTEVLLASYIIYGKKVFKYLKGMFSFLIYDSLKDSIVFSRDHLGQKPLYFYKDKRSIFFSSEIKPIQKFFNLNLNDNEIKNYLLTNNYGYSRETFFQEINQVNAGEYGTLKLSNSKNEEFKFKQFFSKTNLKYSKSKNSNRFNKNLIRITNQHLISDTSIGICLSSGLDSRSICAILFYLKKISILKIAYFIHFKNFDLEKSDVVKFCKYFDIKYKIINIIPRDVIKMFNESIVVNEAPLGGIMNIGLIKLFKQAKKDNIKVLLGGYGLDECLGGYDILNPNLKLKNIINLKYTLIDGTKLSNFRFIRNYNKRKQVGEFLRNTNNLIHKFQLDMIFKYKIPRTMHMIDRASMSSSIEFRNPYVDSRFIEASLSLDKDKYYDNSLGKMPMRNFLMSNIKFYNHWFIKKKTIQSPQTNWLKNKILVQWIDKIIFSKNLYKKNKYLKKKEVQLYWKRFKKNKINFGLPIWQIINIYYLKKNFK